MRHKLLILISIATSGMCLAGSSMASTEVYTWTDSDGIRHFGNKQFAPLDGGEIVALQRANGMDVPAGVTYTARNDGRTSFRKIGRGEKKNPRGWRGYHGRVKRNINRRR